MKRKVLVALVLAGVLGVTSKSSAGWWLFNRFQLQATGPILGTDGQFTNFTFGVMRDKNDPLGQCILIVRDNETKQFSMVSVGTMSCGDPSEAQ